MRAVMAVLLLAACGDPTERTRLASIEERLRATEQWVAHPKVGPGPEPEWMSGQWWCRVGGCFRTKPDCEAKGTGDCVLQRLAWCGPNDCYQSYGLCVVTEPQDARCVGVE